MVSIRVTSTVGSVIRSIALVLTLLYATGSGVGKTLTGLDILSGASDSAGTPRPFDTLHVDFLSDSQEPLWPETLKLPRNNNARARGLIFGQILSDGPDAVVHLGDMAALGFLRTSWAATDSFVAHLDARKIPFYPILGNHELIFFPSAGTINFQERFPNAPKTGYLRRIGPLALILLNSNFSNLTIEEGRQQLGWYSQTLRTLDNDTTVQMIVVAAHHSPYTNSTIVTPSADVRELFVPPFLAAPKAKLFLSGHAHAVEYFRMGGKDFLVIGGGGGLQQPLLAGEEQRWPDLFPEKSSLRMFHFLRCSIAEQGIVFTIVMVNNTFDGFRFPLTLRYPLDALKAPTQAIPQAGVPGN